MFNWSEFHFLKVTFYKIHILVTYLQCEGVRATNDTNKPKTPETPKITPVQNPVPISEIFSKASIFQLEPE